MNNEKTEKLRGKIQSKKTKFIALFLSVMMIFTIAATLLLTRTLTTGFGINPFTWNISISPIGNSHGNMEMSGENIIIDLDELRFEAADTFVYFDFRITNESHIRSRTFATGRNLRINNVQQISTQSNLSPNPRGQLNSADPSRTLTAYGIWIRDNENDDWEQIIGITRSGNTHHIPHLYGTEWLYLEGNSTIDIRLGFNFTMLGDVLEIIPYEISYSMDFQPTN